VIHDAVTTHLAKNNLTKNRRHRFMTGKSCTPNLSEFLEAATTAVDRGEAYDVVYLDFAKAFHKVAHQHLMKKMSERCQEMGVQLAHKKTPESRSQWQVLDMGGCSVRCTLRKCTGSSPIHYLYQ
jgi:hypothetical protein